MKPDADNNQIRRTARYSQILLASCLVMIVLHLWGATKPFHENWGVHLFAFYPSWICGIALIVSLSLFIPAVRATIGRKVAKLAQGSSRIPGPIIFLTIGGVTVLLSNLFPARINLLGDSDLILSLTPQNPGVQDISANFRNQPLTYYALRAVQYVLGGGSSVDVGYTYQILDEAAGLLFISLLLFFLHFLKISPLEKLLIGGYVFLQTSLQFFFGYVENYALLSVLMMAFMITGWLALEKELHPIYAIISFALMIGLHLGSIIFLPAPLILLYQIWRERRVQAGLLALGGILGSALFFHLSNYSLEQFIRRIESGIQNDMLPFFKTYPAGPYAMFSGLHLIDWTNACLFLVSFGCFLVPVLFYFSARDIRWTSPLFIFLVTATLCGFAFTFVFNAALGMARDWDLLVSFLIPFQFLAVYLLLLQFRNGRGIHQIVLVVLILSALRVGAWIGINADPNRHLQRAEILTTPGLSGTFPVIYYEGLGKVFWHRNDYERSRIWYERYLTIDSLNPRILGNLAEVYEKLGEEGKHLWALKRAVAMKSTNPIVYMNLGVECAARRDTASAIQYNEEAVALDPAQTMAHYNLALLYCATRNYGLADKHISAAVASGLRAPALFQSAGDVCLEQKEYDRALRYYTAYLEMVPGDKRVQELRDKIRGALP